MRTPAHDNIRVIVATTLANVNTPHLQRISLGALTLPGKLLYLHQAVEILDDLARAGYEVIPIINDRGTT